MVLHLPFGEVYSTCSSRSSFISILIWAAPSRDVRAGSRDRCWETDKENGRTQFFYNVQPEGACDSKLLLSIHLKSRRLDRPEEANDAVTSQRTEEAEDRKDKSDSRDLSLRFDMSIIKTLQRTRSDSIFSS
ncbi:unnamed protein product [Pleuronectes platessa]|uniref:Uncharacterized protein n=1 Tax=Pleuronectes platessa TaxID=8262 RepID=A0A9N7VVR1_PLEPL|nr:unnamed protein product [Pleuronectes platessa]